MADLNTNGIHHITAISSSATENLDFYEQVLGLRLVKQTVNFDDPYTYHLYYGDADGRPGTILTFFPWERMRGGLPGAGMIVATAFAVARRSIPYWAERLRERGTQFEAESRFDDLVLRFKDPHGLAIELIGTRNPPLVSHWGKSPVDRENAIRGFHSATALQHSLEDTGTLLTALMGMTLVGQDDQRYRFSMNGPGLPGQYFDVAVDPDAPKGRMGAGAVHHIAFRAGTDREQMLWQADLRREGYSVTEVRDRKYFKSIYFHEPGGVLFEFATEAPGFAVDEEAEKLGLSLKLPAWYEPIRSRIEAALPPLRTTHEVERVFVHPKRGLRRQETINRLQ